MKIKIIKHYPQGQLGGDYYFVEIEIDGEVVQRYEDDYHDKGKEKADGFVDGFKHALRDDSIEVENIDIDDLDEE